jgi:hypothetical protein
MAVLVAMVARVPTLVWATAATAVPEAPGATAATQPTLAMAVTRVPEVQAVPAEMPSGHRAAHPATVQTVRQANLLELAVPAISASLGWKTAGRAGMGELLRYLRTTALALRASTLRSMPDPGTVAAVEMVGPVAATAGMAEMPVR